MRRIHRIVLLATLVAIMPVLAGCADFDPDKLDVFGLNEKKKLPGERKPLFPDGVPGVTQGIPPEYVKGNEAAAATLTPLPAEPTAEDQRKAAAANEPTRDGASKPAAAIQAKPAAKRTVRRKAAPKAPKVASKPEPKPKPAAAAPVQPVAQQRAEPWPAPAQQQQQQASPWPPAQSAQGSSATSPWPAAPPAGSSSR